jgi:hypothetical protein
LTDAAVPGSRDSRITGSIPEKLGRYADPSEFSCVILTHTVPCMG